jgi:folate-binding protein YgfZ
VISAATLAPEIEASYRAAWSGCLLVGPDELALIELIGEDRGRFLNGLMTCDVGSLAAGQGSYGFFTDRLGKILADGVVLALEDRLWIELPASTLDTVAAHLQSYVIADRVEIRRAAGWSRILLVGPAAEAVAGDATPPAAPWSHREVTPRGARGRALRQERVGAQAIAVWSPAEEAPRAIAAVEAGAGVAAARHGAPAALDILRVEAGIARFGQDFDREHFPQETGAEEAAVSYTKGCYLGQEIVARIHYRGQAQHAMRGLVFSATLPAPGAVLELDGREVARVTSAVVSPRRGGPIGLSCLHRRGAEPGTRLRCAEQDAEVRELGRILD